MEIAFFYFVSGSKTTSLSGTETTLWRWVLSWAHSTGHHLDCVALSPGHETGYFLSWSGPQAFTCLLLSWRLSQSTQVLNIHNYLVREASFYLLKLYVPQIPEGDTFSFSNFDDQVVCFIHAVHYCLCVFKNLNIAYMQSNTYYVPRTMLEYPPPLRILTATFEVPCGPLSQRDNLGITGPEILM